MKKSPSADWTRQVTPVKRRRSFHPRLRGLVAAIAGLAMIGSIALVGTTGASADTAPPNPNDPKTPVTVSADALPTVQINGVVWNQAVIGNTAYAVGSFSTARPAGAAANTQTVTRNNILAYDIRTGDLINSFAPSLNAQAYSVTASPDGTRLYIGGDFTSISGTQVWRVAALNPATGAVITSFLPRMGASVRALTASNSTVYMGGLFPNVGSVSRDRLAAVRASDGGLLPWAPKANQRVNAMVLSPNATQVVIGGVFTTLNGSDRPGYGLGRVDATTGTNLPLDANNIVRDAGPQSAILSLSSDGTNFYGTGYIYGTGGNLEGAFSANWSDGKIRWVEDCHGDSYGAWASSTAVYVAGHSHYCQNIGGFPETEPRSYHRGLAFSKAATGTMTRDTQGYPSFTGIASPSLLNWYPDLDTGTITGQNQGPWGVTGNEQYVLMGGEFRNVNGKAQQGLVRFAVSSIAPNKDGPRGTVTPTASYVSPGKVKVNWGTYWDRDNTNLNYQVVRDGNTASPVFQGNQISVFWQRPGMTFTDSGLSAGNHNYRIVTRDPFGNTVTSSTVSVNVPVGGAGNSPPTAAFTSSTAALTVSLNGSGSTDSDGTIAAFDWDYGDSTAHGSGATASHTYQAAGTYQVVLKITDNGGATATATKSVQVTDTPPPGGGVLAQDNFGRTVTNGLGSADVGGAWSLNGAGTAFAVSGGQGAIKTSAAGSGPGAYLNSVSSSNADTSVAFSMDKIANGGGSYVYVSGRNVAGAGEYRAKVKVAADGGLTLYTTSVTGGTVTTLKTANIAGFKLTANQAVMIRLQVLGTSPTTIQAKLWPASDTEPGTWTLTGTDNRANMQAPGSVGLLTYVSGATTNVPITMKFDNLLVKSLN